MSKVTAVPVSNFDGESLYAQDGEKLYHVGNFLGSGASGTVYEAICCRTKKLFALKVLNPIGYKQMSPYQLSSAGILSRGHEVDDMRSNFEISEKNIWWLFNFSSKQYHAAFFSRKSGSLRELSLSHCIKLWGFPNVNNIDFHNEVDDETQHPALPNKFVEIMKSRAQIFREIENMRKVSKHKNVIKLEGAYESIDDSKISIFLVMEYVNGGELFDRIRENGASETTVRIFFKQLLAGVHHCHSNGVCHRDLKPEVNK